MESHITQNNKLIELITECIKKCDNLQSEINKLSDEIKNIKNDISIINWYTPYI